MKAITSAARSAALITALFIPTFCAAEEKESPQRPKVEAVFVLDTTGSMSDLIQAAKDKIWSVANTLAQAKPTPDIKVGLVGYRDRGDAYVTKLVPQTSDLDAMYRTLMDFQAAGGGDTPESVNEALNDAVNKFDWSKSKDTYKVIFLVGDAPPHMDYPQSVKYPAVMESARAKGIVVNSIQCGDMQETTPIWKEIAKLGKGEFFQVAQNGDAFVASTPYDEKLTALSAERDGTKRVWGTAAQKSAESSRDARAKDIAAAAPPAALASRAVFNASAAGEKNFAGDQELVSDVASGKVKLEDVKKDELPAELQSMTPEERAKEVQTLNERRQQLDSEISALAKQRQDFLAAEAKKQGKDKNSLDAKVFSALKTQAQKCGLTYEGGPAY